MPAETHTHYAADGETVTGYTVVEREPRLTDVDRHELLALAMYEADLCQCGTPITLGEQGLTRSPDSRVCPTCAAAAVWSRVLADQDEQWKKANKDALPKVQRPSDGRHLTMRFLTPTQAAAERERRAKGGDHGHQA